MHYLCAVPTVRYITKMTHCIPYSTWGAGRERQNVIQSAVETLVVVSRTCIEPVA